MAETTNPEADVQKQQKASQKDAVERLAARPGRGIDAGEADLGWTAQQGAQPAREREVPGQVIVEAQLPDADVQREWGIDPEAYKAGLYLADDKEALTLAGGPEPDEALRLGLVSDFKSKTLHERVVDGEAKRDEDAKSDLQKDVAAKQAADAKNDQQH